MATTALSGSDTIIVNNRLITNTGDGDVAHLTFPNEIAALKTGKNGNSIYSLNESGAQIDFILRIIRGSGDDKFLNGLLNAQRANFAGFVLMTGEFVKRLGDGAGNISSDTYILSGGIFIKGVEAKSNVEADVEQSLSIYNLRFANAPRTLT